MNVETRKSESTKIWDWPLRIWHWLLAITVTVALVTGLNPKLDLMNVHQWAGMSVVALLVFRVLWGIIGGTYSKLWHYFTTPIAFFKHFLGKSESKAHSSPGIVIALCLFGALAVQSTAGLFTSDDVLFDGPLVQFADGDLVEFASDIHDEGWKFVLTFISIHLCAHLIYGVVLRNTIALSMFTGHKLAQVPPTQHSNWMAVIAYATCVAVLLLLVYYSL